MHPLRVESVAWLAERKDVLSGFFALLSVFAWLRVLRPVHSRWSRAVAYLVSLLLFTAALLVKSSVAPLPAVLLLLDVWPLRRLPLSPAISALRSSVFRIAEKLPFFVPAAVSSTLSAVAHANSGVLRDAPLVVRLASAPLHAAFYLVKTILPFRLSPLYLDIPVTVLRVLAALLILACLTAGAVHLRRRAPALLLGLLVFCTFLFPVSGIVRFGIQSIADRFTYLPAIGLSIALTAVPAPSSPSRRRLAVLALLAWLALCSAVILHLLPTWRNPDTLNDRVLACNPGQPRVLVSKAIRLLDAGHLQEALPLAASAGQSWDPYSFVNARILHAIILQELGRPADALPVLLDIPRGVMNPARLCAIDWELARVHFALGRFDEALAEANRALGEMAPEDAPAARPPLLLLARAAAHRAGHPSEALSHARFFPPYATRTGISDSDLLPFHLYEWANRHRTAAAPFFRGLLDSGPDLAIANNLVWGLATAVRSPIPAGEILDAATRLAAGVPSNPGILDTLAAAQARAGHFDAAQTTLRRAIALLADIPPSPARTRFEDRLVARLDLYGRNLPCSEEGFSLWYSALCGETAKSTPAP